MTTESEITEILSRHAPDPASAAAAGADTPLFEGGLELDSLAFLEAVLEIEQQTGIKMDEETLEDSSLNTIGSLAARIAQLRAG